MFEQILIAVGGGGLGATIVGLFNAFFGRKKMSAEATRVIEESASSAVKRVDADNARLRERLEKLEAIVEELRGSVRSRDDRIDKLADEIRSRDRRIDELSSEVDELTSEIGELTAYAMLLRDELQRQDPTHRLPDPPARVARHFLPPPESSP